MSKQSLEGEKASDIVRKVDYMATIISKGERVRQAIKWISSERLEDEKKVISLIIEEGALRFNLSPKEEDFLHSFYRERKDP